MSKARRKFYVVWQGYSPGIYDSWTECQQQTVNYPGAKFKSFDSLEEATAAYRGNPEGQLEPSDETRQRGFLRQRRLYIHQPEDSFSILLTYPL